MDNMCAICGRYSIDTLGNCKHGCIISVMTNVTPKNRFTDVSIDYEDYYNKSIITIERLELEIKALKQLLKRYLELED
jgi:hypothetical protein